MLTVIHKSSLFRLLTIILVLALMAVPAFGRDSGSAAGPDPQPGNASIRAADSHAASGGRAVGKEHDPRTRAANESCNGVRVPSVGLLLRDGMRLDGVGPGLKSELFHLECVWLCRLGIWRAGPNNYGAAETGSGRARVPGRSARLGGVPVGPLSLADQAPSSRKP